jgi:hypothetical protein
LGEIRLSGGELEEVVVRLHGLSPADRALVNSRHRYLVQLDFPASPGAGRRRSGYDLERAMQMVTAFRLLECSQAPLRVARHVVRNWSVYARAYLASWRMARDQGSKSHPQPGIDRFILAIAPSALRDASDGIPATDEVPDDLQVITPVEMERWMSASSDDGDDVQLLMIDPLRLINRAEAAILEILRADAEEFEEALRMWGLRAFGAAEWKFI